MKEGLFFSIDFVALAIAGLFLAIGFLFWQLSVSAPTPTFFFSQVALGNLPTSFKKEFAFLPSRLYPLGILFLLLAFLDPHFFRLQEPGVPSSSFLPIQGSALYLLLDRSGSMSQTVVAEGQEGGLESISKINLLKAVTEQFIQQRPSDLVGVIAFARFPSVLAPLTLDHARVEEQLKQLKVVGNPQEDGTAMGYAILKTVRLIQATRTFAQQLKSQKESAYEIKNSMMIMVTDGFQDPNPLDRGDRLRTMGLEEAAAEAKQAAIRLYLINIDPEFAKEEFAPHRRLMERSAALTGGKFYLVTQAQDLKAIYQEINQLEKETLPYPFALSSSVVRQRTFSLYPWLIMAALFCLATGQLLETTLFRRAP